MVGDILQPTHLLFVLVVALIVLGPKRLPEAGRALGRGLRDFRSAISGESTSEHTIPGPEPSAPTAQPTQPTAETPATSQHSEPGPDDTAQTEVQAPQETAEPVTSSASAAPRA